MFSGDFVRSNGLQEGDFIVIYSDVKCGKYVWTILQSSNFLESKKKKKVKNLFLGLTKCK